MNQSNVQSLDGVTLVGAGNPKPQDLDEAIALAPTVVAADGGANACVAQGIEPIAVIGDLDSLLPETRSILRDSALIKVTEQDSTDFEKCLERIEAPFLLAVGFAAARLDHTLAVLSAMVRNQGPPVILIGEKDVTLAVPPALSLDLPLGSRFSLFPMTKVVGSSQGLRWPIDGIELDPMNRIGTSNEVIGPISLSFDRPGCLLVLPRSALEAMLAGLFKR